MTSKDNWLTQIKTEAVAAFQRKKKQKSIRDREQQEEVADKREEYREKFELGKRILHVLEKRLKPYIEALEKAGYTVDIQVRERSFSWNIPNHWTKTRIGGSSNALNTSTGLGKFKEAKVISKSGIGSSSPDNRSRAKEEHWTSPTLNIQITHSALKPKRRYEKQGYFRIMLLPYSYDSVETVKDGVEKRPDYRGRGATRYDLVTILKEVSRVEQGIAIRINPTSSFSFTDQYNSKQENDVFAFSPEEVEPHVKDILADMIQKIEMRIMEKEEAENARANAISRFLQNLLSL